MTDVLKAARAAFEAIAEKYDVSVAPMSALAATSDPAKPFKYAHSNFLFAIFCEGVGAKVSDAERLDWMASEECQIENLALQSATRYRIRWPDLDEAQSDWFADPRAAIDAAIRSQQAQAGEEGGDRGSQ